MSNDTTSTEMSTKTFNGYMKQAPHPLLSDLVLRQIFGTQKHTEFWEEIKMDIDYYRDWNNGIPGFIYNSDLVEFGVKYAEFILPAMMREMSENVFNHFGILTETKPAYQKAAIWALEITMHHIELYLIS